MSIEKQVGAFVFAGLVLLGLAVFLLGDFSLERRYKEYVNFNDVGGLSKQASVRLSGVEVGKVSEIRLTDGKAQAVASIRQGVKIYRDATFSIGSTGIIGSKFLEIDQGHPDKGVLPPDSELEGVDPVSIEKALTKALNSLQDLLGGEGKAGSVGNNLNATLSNVRSLTANLDEMVSDIRPHMTDAMARVDGISAKLDQVLSQTNTLLASLNSGKGPVGALLNDESMKTDVKETVASLRKAADSASDALGRINQFRVFWNYDWRYDSIPRIGYSDVGLKIVPRDGRYYYGGVSNLGNTSNAVRNRDYVHYNTIDALLGWDWRYADLGVGVLRSGGGARLTVTPFADDPLGQRFSLVAQAYDFGRDRVINGRHFTHPEIDFGAMFRPHRILGLGARVEDVQETKRFMTWVNVNFEDKDVAYLFGLATFGAAGTKGRSKSGSSH